MVKSSRREGVPGRGDPASWPGWRVGAIRIWYGLLFAWALSMSAGIAILALGRAGAGEQFRLATVPAWRLLATGGAFWICWTGGRSVVAFQALATGWLGWLLSGLFWAVKSAGHSMTISVVAAIGLWIVPLVALRPHRTQLWRVRPQPSAILLPLALVAAVPLVIYAARQGAQATDGTGTSGPYVMTELGVALAAQAVFAALRPAGSAWLPRVAAITAFWVGIAAIIRPTDLGSFGSGRGTALVGWAALFWVAGHFESRREEPTAGKPIRIPHTIDTARLPPLKSAQ